VYNIRSQKSIIFISAIVVLLSFLNYVHG